MEEIVRRMVSALDSDYLGDVTVGKQKSVDETTGLEYFPVNFTKDDLGDGFVITGGKFFPEGPDGTRAMVVEMVDTETEDSEAIADTLMQKVSNGAVIDNARHLGAPCRDWYEPFRSVEQQAKSKAELEALIAQGRKLVY